MTSIHRTHVVRGNDLYGKPGEALCVCDRGVNGDRHLNASDFCTVMCVFELQYVEDSGALYQCTCDPQDPYSKEARLSYIAEGNEGALDPPPDPCGTI